MIVIKGLLPEISEQELVVELKALGLEIFHVRQFGNDTHKLPIHMVTLDSNSSNKLIF